MHIQVDRFQEMRDSTIGRLSIDGEFECYTLEDGVRAEKVAGRTAIPAGTYRLVVNHSPRFNKPMPRLLDVPGFEGILIHPGNTAADTDGCLLVGRVWEAGAERVGQSRLAFASLFEKIRAAITRGETVSVRMNAAPDDAALAPPKTRSMRPVGPRAQISGASRHDLPKVCSERSPPGRSLLPLQSMQKVQGRMRAIGPIGRAWMNGSTLSVKFIGGTASQHRRVMEEARWWTAHANLTFDFNNVANADIRVAFDRRDGAWSYVGTECRSIPLDQPTMNLGFLDPGTAAHEFGHAIGLAHEHQNPGARFRWNEQVVIEECAGPPNFWDEATTRHNILERYSRGQVNGTKFDPDSIMLYFFPDHWVRGGKGTRSNEVLSDLDRQFVASARMYPGPGSALREVVELKLDAKRSAASIRNYGEEDQYRFVVKAAGRYVVDTSGSTDVVMKLFGPDSMTALVDEDDDSGVGENARIITDLRPGSYYVQIRHFSRTRGTGRYAVGVRRARKARRKNT